MRIEIGGELREKMSERPSKTIKKGKPHFDLKRLHCLPLTLQNVCNALQQEMYLPEYFVKL